jgi:transcriptional regulator with XRE-family HTH domain
VKTITFARLMRRRRRQLGLTLAQVAKVADVTRSYISCIETGVCGAPTPWVIRRLSKVLDLPLKPLLALGHAGSASAIIRDDVMVAMRPLVAPLMVFME